MIFKQISLPIPTSEKIRKNYLTILDMVKN
jgi:hypothetical protein